MGCVFECVGANGENGLCVVYLTQLLSVIKSISIYPAFDHPGGVRLGDGKVFDGLGLCIGIGDGFSVFGDAA